MCRRGDPALAPWLHALPNIAGPRGDRRLPRGGCSGRGEGRLGLGAQPPPAARPLGRQSGSAPLVFWARGVRVLVLHQLHSARTREFGSRIMGAARRRPGGGNSCLREGCPGFGTLPPPTARPLGVQPGPAAPFPGPREVRVWGPARDPTDHFRDRGSFGCAVRARCPSSLGAEGAGVGARYQPHSACSCELALRAAEAAGGRSGGRRRLLPPLGVSGAGHYPHPGCPPFGHATGARCPFP